MFETVPPFKLLLRSSKANTVMVNYKLMFLKITVYVKFKFPITLKTYYFCRHNVITFTMLQKSMPNPILSNLRCPVQNLNRLNAL